jgi:hypothetical protein
VLSQAKVNEKPSSFSELTQFAVNES